MDTSRESLNKIETVDRLFEIASQTGIRDELGDDGLQEILAGAFSYEQSFPLLSDEAIGIRKRVRVQAGPPDILTLHQNVTALNLNEFLSQKFPPREKMLTPWLSTSCLTMIYAPRGTGKTLLMHGVALAVAALPAK